jgi:hypothetical protein
MKLKRRILWLIWPATAVLSVLAFIYIVVSQATFVRSSCTFRQSFSPTPRTFFFS